MKYTLKVYAIWEQGPREKQEDAMFPVFGKAKDSDRLFILCDGMGGHSAGEVASQTVCAAMSTSVLSHCPDAEGAFTDDDFRLALNDAFDELDTKDNGAARKMGTTLTFLKLHAEGATIAHMGDSRVYHIRPGQTTEDTQILFQTVDHSLVNDLVKVGELTPEEAKNFDRKNVITRAMQPNMERRPRADIHHLSDIRPGDYFMLCSDGILEQMEDTNLQYIFSAKGGNGANKVDMLIKVTDHNRDNHSAILVEITGVEDTPKLPREKEMLMAQVEEDEARENELTPADSKSDSSEVNNPESVQTESGETKLKGKKEVENKVEKEKAIPDSEQKSCPLCVKFVYLKYLFFFLLLLLLIWGGYQLYSSLCANGH